MIITQQNVYYDNTVASAANYYTYDALYRLIQAKGREHAGGNVATSYYQYDYAGQRVRKTIINTAKMRKYFLQWEVYAEYDTSTSVVSLERETLHIMDDKARIALIDTPITLPVVGEVQLLRYQFSNHLSTASLELDVSAAIISYEEYYPYGNTSFQCGRSGAEVSLKRYRYTGKERDEETGFNYHGARYYIPWLARWAASEPLLYLFQKNESGKEHSFSEIFLMGTYCYVGDNPISFNDPEGKRGVSTTKLSEGENSKSNPDVTTIHADFFYDAYDKDPGKLLNTMQVEELQNTLNEFNDSETLFKNSDGRWVMVRFDLVKKEVPKSDDSNANDERMVRMDDGESKFGYYGNKIGVDIIDTLPGKVQDEIGDANKDIISLVSKNLNAVPFSSDKYGDMGKRIMLRNLFKHEILHILGGVHNDRGIMVKQVYTTYDKDNKNYYSYTTIDEKLIGKNKDNIKYIYERIGLPYQYDNGKGMRVPTIVNGDSLPGIIYKLNYFKR